MAAKKTIRYCEKYHKKKGNAKRKCRKFGRRKMSDAQKKYFGGKK